MPINFQGLSQHIQSLAKELRTDLPDRRAILDEAIALFNSLDEDTIEAARDAQSTTQRLPWLVARPLTYPLDAKTAAPPPPHHFIVAAADGSNMPPDRHTSIQFYVINTGMVWLEYGGTAQCELETETTLYYQTEDLYLDGEARQYPVEGSRLSARMAIAELHALRRAVEEARHRIPDTPIVALLDGTLILWTIQTEPDQVRKPLLEEYLQVLDWFAEQHIPVASYISDSGSYELTNLLRIAICARQTTCCRPPTPPATEGPLALCRSLERIRDAALMRRHLSPGERSILFASESQILKHYREHEVRFFYMHTGEEIARVEIPDWVAQDPDLLALTHAALWDQCRRSGSQPPYPPALHEAHECAVLSTQDRQNILNLIEEELARYQISIQWSAKSMHKRLRGV
ncbi:DNA double-strand break repair nuclease NurA [Ardenticatena maritima]|uniref:DNA double-strand break repair nuclease NurA n=3 Tax=Ardenticatena maritima TaxID=872965 RepID=UPI000761D055|nr:DNA double-strand break repair nuclease NurA [Ardenticatena maritima]